MKQEGNTEALVGVQFAIIKKGLTEKVTFGPGQEGDKLFQIEGLVNAKTLG